MRTRLSAPLAALLLTAVSCATSPSGAPRSEADSSGWTDQSAAAPERVDASQAPPVSESSAPPAPAPVSAPPPEAEPDNRPRIGALGPHTWVYKRAEYIKPALGKLRIGTSVVLKSPDPVPGRGCPGGWYEVEPRGFVCNNNTATLDLDDPYYRALADSAPKAGRWPYHYAHSNGAPMYSRVPTPEEWEKAERRHGKKGFKPLGAWAKGHEELISDKPIVGSEEVPYFLEGGKRTAPGGYYSTKVLVWRRIPAGSMLAYSRAFEMYGRTWLLTPDTMVVPADRVSHMRRSEFSGVYFDESSMKLPFAWNRTHGPVPKYRRQDDGSFAKSGEVVPPKTPMEITGDEVKHDGWVYYELRNEPGVYMGKSLKPTLDYPVTITRKVKKPPRGVPANGKWLDVRIVPGTLTAYVGTRPVLATLFSPGKGGPPVPGLDHTVYATTATGFYPVEWKERVATMSNEKGVPKVLWFTDVPHQQYLRAPLAMHVAYWHEDFGIRKSAECVNLSPKDGEFLFGFTEPQLPEGWNAVRPGDGFGKSTPIVPCRRTHYRNCFAVQVFVASRSECPSHCTLGAIVPVLRRFAPKGASRMTSRPGSPHWLWLSSAVLLVAGITVGCGDDDSDGSGGSTNTGASNSGGAGGDTGTGATGGQLFGGDGSGGGGGLQGCATDTVLGEPVPINMVVMLDQSGSMNDVIGGGATRWEAVTGALSSFMAQAPADLGLGIQYFPLFQTPPIPCVDNTPCGPGVCNLGFCLPEPAYECTSAPYGILEVGIGNVSTNAALIDANLLLHAPFGATPTGPALSGAIDAAKASAAADPTRRSVVVLATDGLPTQCSPTDIGQIGDLAMTGNTTSPSVPTFVIGVGSNLSNLNAIAAAGGTGQAFLVEDANATQQFIDALNAIGQTLTCEFSIPDPEDGEVDYGLVNVQYTTSAGDSVIFKQVTDAGACDAATGGWYYDDPNAPTLIILCPASCTTVKDDPNGQVDIVLGCKTQVPA